ncbi:MAG: DNA translocase FtsK 4TM domain-containing protein [Chloroflexota bacterium]
MLIIGIVLLFTTAILALSLLWPNQGQFTAFISQTMGRGFGLARFVIPIATGLAGAYFVLRGMDQQPKLPVYRLIGLAVLFFIFAAFASLVVVRRNPAFGDVYAAAQAGQGGGYVGALLSDMSVQLLGNLGTIVTLIVFGILGAILVSGISRKDVSGWLEQASQARTATPEGDVLPVGERNIRLNPNRSRATDITPEPAPAQLPLITDEEVKQGKARSKSTPAETPRPAPKPTAKPARSRQTATAEATAEPVYIGGTQPTSAGAPLAVSDGYTGNCPILTTFWNPGLTRI